MWTGWLAQRKMFLCSTPLCLCMLPVSWLAAAILHTFCLIYTKVKTCCRLNHAIQNFRQYHNFLLMSTILRAEILCVLHEANVAAKQVRGRPVAISTSIFLLKVFKTIICKHPKSIAKYLHKQISFLHLKILSKCR